MIRRSGGWTGGGGPDGDRCPTCGGRACDPYRAYDESAREVVEGCIDAHHTGHLVPSSGSNHWHNSPQAKKLRAARKKAR